MGWPYTIGLCGLFDLVGFSNEGLLGPVGFSNPSPCGSGPNHEKWANLTSLPKAAKHFSLLPFLQKIVPYSLLFSPQ